MEINMPLKTVIYQEKIHSITKWHFMSTLTLDNKSSLNH